MADQTIPTIKNLRGNIGIGLASPSTPLHVKGNIRAEASGSTAFADLKSSQIYASSTYDLIVGTNNPLFFRTNSERRMTILGGGNVGIGTTDPLVPLHVQGTALTGYVSGDVNADTMMVIENDDNARLAIVAGSLSDVLFGDAVDQDVGRIRYNHSSDSMAFFTAGAECMRIEDSGEVGIGTTSPNYLLDVEKAGAAMRVYNLTDNGNTDLRIQTVGSTGSSRIFFGDTADSDVGSIIYRHNGNSLAFETNDFERMRIDSSGDVGIGVTDPDYKLHVNGAVAIKGGEAADTARIIFQASDENNRFILESDFNSVPSTDLLGFRSSSTDNMLVLKGNGNIGIGTAAPDEKFHVDSGNILLSNGNYMIFDGPTPKQTKIRSSYDGSQSHLELRVSNNIEADFAADGCTKLSHVTSTTGGKFLVRNYSASDYLTVFSTEYSSGANCIGYGAAGKQGGAGFVSTYDNFAGHKTILKVNHNGVNVLTTGSSATDTVGADLSMAERFRVQVDKSYFNNGPVGVGTESPDGTFHVKSTGNGESYVERASGAKVITQAQSAKGVIGTYSNHPLSFSTNAGERVFITTAGDVGIGAASPAEKLQVDGYVRTKNSKYKKYTSLSGSSNDWFPIYRVNDHKGGQVLFTVNTYAHSSCTFIVSEGYGPSGETGNPAHINVLNYLYHPNGGYANITGIRVNQIGMVEIKLTFTSGPSVNVAVRVESSEELQSSLASSLATSTSTEAISDTVTLSNKYARFKNLTIGNDGAVSLPALNFGSSGSTGLYYDSSNTALRVSIAGTQRAYIAAAGVFSTANFYSGQYGEFRNYSGTWKATTGTGTNGFLFHNTNESNAAASITSKGTLTLNGGTTATGMYLYETYSGVGGSNYERTHFKHDSGYFTIDTGALGTGTLSGIRLAVGGNTKLQIEPAGHLLINGAEDNGNKADFAVATGGGNPTVSWRTDQVQIGSSDMNWEGKVFEADGMFQMAAWSRNMRFYSQQGTGTSGLDFIFSPWDGNNITERLRIKGDGKVGIGTTSPSYKLDIGGTTSSTANTLRIGQNNGGTAIRIGTGGGDSDVTLMRVDGNSTGGQHDGATDISAYGFSMKYMGSRSGNNNSLSWFCDNQTGTQAEFLTFNNNGNVGIGATSPAHRLDVVGTYRISDNTTNANNKLHRMLGRHYTNAEQDVNIFSSISTSSTNVVSFGGGSSSYNTATHILFYTASNNTSTYAVGQERFRIHNNGNIGIAIGSPEQKLHVDGAIRSKVYTVNTLPAANSTAVGTRAFVSDSQMSPSGNFGATIAGYGSGSYTVPVWCDGAYWYIG